MGLYGRAEHASGALILRMFSTSLWPTVLRGQMDHAVQVGRTGRQPRGAGGCGCVQAPHGARRWGRARLNLRNSFRLPASLISCSHPSDFTPVRCQGAAGGKSALDACLGDPALCCPLPLPALPPLPPPNLLHHIPSPGTPPLPRCAPASWEPPPSCRTISRSAVSDSLTSGWHKESCCGISAATPLASSCLPVCHRK